MSYTYPQYNRDAPDITATQHQRQAGPATALNCAAMKKTTPQATPASSSQVWKPHVTVATMVVRDDRFLMVEELIRGRLLLNQPAGHLEPDETLAEAARRETLEETGWEVTLTALLSIQQWSCPNSARQFVRFCFAGDALRHHPDSELDEGIVRALWLSRDEVAAATARLRSPLVLTSIDDWFHAPRLPLEALRRVDGPATTTG